MNIFDILKIMFFEINNNTVFFNEIYSIKNIYFETYDNLENYQKSEIKKYDDQKNDISVFELFYNKNDTARLYVKGDKLLFITNNKGYKITEFNSSYTMDINYCEAIFNYIVFKYNLNNETPLNYSIYEKNIHKLSYYRFQKSYTGEAYNIYNHKINSDEDDICVFVGHNEYLLYDEPDYFELIFKNGIPLKMVFNSGFYDHNKVIWNI